jgi:glyoxylase-like metal-dependent hydrolase (beta-lactamase superfamily II)
VHIHPADAARLRTGLRDVIANPVPGQLLAFLTRPLKDPRPLLHGDVLPPLGGLHVVHTPGHTPGSVCLYAPGLRLLFTGDVLQFRQGRLTRPHPVFSDDLAEARRSLERLAELDVDTICFAHYPPLRGGVHEALQELAEVWA